MNYHSRFEKLNQKQRQAVETIDGPLLVLAGPGTGKTELLSMRAANILQKTDTLPSNILCLTFTESGSQAMRNRLTDIIGQDAYKVAIQTFHAFGSEIINQNAEYFYRGAKLLPADELHQYEIMRDIFAELPYTSPLAGMNGDEYTHLKDSLRVISELKHSGLTTDELRKILDANDSVIDAIRRDLSAVFQNPISKSTVHLLAPIARDTANLKQPNMPAGITPYANVLSLALAHAIDEAVALDSTKPITAWKNSWCEKNDRGEVVLKDQKRHDKLRAVAYVYFEYVSRMQAAGLYDYDDMLLYVIHAVETQPSLLANLQEKYQYIMVDEFQDTNLAQLRLLFNLTGNNTSANIMAVGDDDQAIYSFQGADVGNIQRFRVQYNDPEVIVLTDNYRSDAAILEVSRRVITQGTDRLETTNQSIVKQLTAHFNSTSGRVDINQFETVDDERQQVANDIASKIASGVDPASIVVLARRHHELLGLVPFLEAKSIATNYERRENVIENQVVGLLEHLCLIIDALHRNEHSEADALLPEIMAHPAFGFQPIELYQLSLTAWRNHQLWLEVMTTSPTFAPFAEWLLVRTAAVHVEPFETQIDHLLGIPEPTELSEDQPANAAFRSPLYKYFFDQNRLETQADTYLQSLEALRTIRDQMREHYTDEEPSIATLIDFISMHRELGSNLTSVRPSASRIESTINLMTAHRSKGLEFDHVYILGAIDSMWGERVRGRSSLIRYPANLPLAPVGDTYDERLRLFFVAMTRAKQQLSISFSTHDKQGKEAMIASFLSEETDLITVKSPSKNDDLAKQVEIDWRGHLSSNITHDSKKLLAPTLEKYKLSATHLGNFIDITKGGPQLFFLNNLLRFPQAKSPSAGFGTAIHATLQQAHDYTKVHHGEKRPLEDVLGDYEKILRDQHMQADDFEVYYNKGIDALSTFLSNQYHTFSATQSTELSFGNQNVMIDQVRLTGVLDLVDIDKNQKTIVVTDYKTGKPSRSWQGKSEYEKIKLHKYRYQLMFYQLLIENSRDYRQYKFDGGVLQFVEPTVTGDIIALHDSFTKQELADFAKLLQAVWNCIMNLSWPDISQYSPSLKGVEMFEADLVDKYL